MSTTQTAQTTQTPNPMMFDPAAMFAAFTEQYAALEAQLVARTQAAISAWAQLAQDAVAYSAQLAAASRKLAV